MHKFESDQSYPLNSENGDPTCFQQEPTGVPYGVSDTTPGLSLQQRRIAEYRALRDSYQRENPDVLNNPFEETLRGLESGTLIAEN